MAVFWIVAPCNLVEIFQRFGGAYCVHHQGDKSVVIIFKTAAVRTQNLT
jgi:hypothetical protein